MPALKVPERFRVGIMKLAGLTQEGYDQLLAALQKAPPCQDTRELLAWMSDEVPVISEADRKAIINSIVPMFVVQRNANVHADIFAQDVWESIADASPELVKGVDKTTAQDRISQLIQQSALDLASARISDVKREVERNFCKVRILTDLRPVFKQDAEDLPTEMAVIHNFQIGHHDGTGKHHEFYVSLDETDLELLKKAIAAAEKRAQTLEKLLNKSGVHLHK